ncbi:Ada metal-binding domain-containing protein [Fictibacillus enclensis]
MLYNFTTKNILLPFCKLRNPNKNNVRFFSRIVEVFSSQFHPCKMLSRSL